ncbi:MAG: NAD(P)/FAD-dependent oxidoreductase, partial [Bacilli bacterium]|nr:NAD(P)/FAD-dependent oxidoreductase [Bacilli bacterium]
MKNFDVVIVGGSAAGLTAAVTARKYYPSKSILMVKDVVNVPIPCGIPYVFGTVGDSMKNLLPTKMMMEKSNVEVMENEVKKIDCINKEVHLSDQIVGYDKLVLATGSYPIKPNLPGANLRNVYTIIKDANILATMFEEMKQCHDFCIIGGGFIGMEMAEEIKKMHPEANINVIEMQDHCLKMVYDDDFCSLAETSVSEQGIHLLVNEKLDSIVGNERVEAVHLASGKEIKADCVIFGIGCLPNTKLAVDAGLSIGKGKGIAVNEYMQTSDPSIFACGD